jgi:D-proline reductase (dithiol) PrdB
VAIVTTAGVHHRDQPPFDMHDREGDPSFRVIDAFRPVSDLMITHDYYDHSDADQDINIVFPVERLKELEREGVIGQAARFHYAFMGHIVGRHIETLVNESAPDVTGKLKADAIDIVLLTPG